MRLSYERTPMGRWTSSATVRVIAYRYKDVVGLYRKRCFRDPLRKVHAKV